jgi:teichuronic acid biosynthesis glycosyltransferase TuaC
MSDKLDVLVASHLYPSSLSRISGSFVHNQTRFLTELCEPRVVAPIPWFPLPGCGRWSRYRDLPAQEQMDGLDVRRPAYLTLPRRLWLGAAWPSYLRALEATAGRVPDVIHAHVAYPDGRACVEYGRRVGRPVVVTVHGHDLKDLAVNRDSWRAWVREALTGADAVIAVSGELVGRAREIGVAAERVEQIPNGVDCDLFRPGTRIPGENGWRLVYLGRYDPAKGLNELLQAMAGLRAEGRDVHLDLVGGGATDLPNDFPAIAAQLGISDRVRFIDEVPWRELPDVLHTADVFVLPSHSEGLPLSLLEALACGLPVVTTRCGGPEEVVNDAVGRLAEPRDVAGLQAALATTLDNYGAFDRDGIRRYAMEQFDYRSVARRIHQVYQQVAAG